MVIGTRQPDVLHEGGHKLGAHILEGMGRSMKKLENMDTRALAEDDGWEFLFVLGQPRFVGAVQAIINPVAIR